MIFDEINNNSIENKIDKHIKLTNKQAIYLNQIQTAYKSQLDENISFNDLISISVDVFLKEIQKQIAIKNELEALKFIENLREV